MASRRASRHRRDSRAVGDPHTISRRPCRTQQNALADPLARRWVSSFIFHERVRRVVAAHIVLVDELLTGCYREEGEEAAPHDCSTALGQPLAYPRAASAWSTIERIDYRLQGMGARVFDGRFAALLGCWLAP